MKLLDKKRIKVKKGEYLAVNERNMLAKVICNSYMYILVCLNMCVFCYRTKDLYTLCRSTVLLW